jgi:hypothetical protein
MLKSLLAILAILGVVALFFDRYDFLSFVAILDACRFLLS